MVIHVICLAPKKAGLLVTFMLPVEQTSYQRLISHFQWVKPLLQKPLQVLLQPPFLVNLQDP